MDKLVIANLDCIDKNSETGTEDRWYITFSHVSIHPSGSTPAWNASLQFQRISSHAIEQKNGMFVQLPV